MYPNKETAIKELEVAGKMNPGPWIKHSYNVANVAKLIAEHCENLNSEKAFVCGLLHDIGRRTGISSVRHIIDGYDYVISKGWDEVARVCLTHSFPVKDIEADIGNKDISKKQYDFINHYLNNLEYNDYDKLIILCDALADANGFCILEKRFVDTTRRYGIYPFSVERWNKTYEYKEYFEKIINKSIYTLLPNIEKSIYY
ncbi:HD domain-containing protein [Clostridioides difficile]|uniref:HD domain-containing protein n=1 Tax=Clostridioides difficile TaxID=1496 RepID=UPI0003B2A6F3|nr:HD domain-containing protein [Clostridioides difficile]EGT4908178.1 HD domain-containing protein [Clostridioides difficile]EGT5013169.1 HD domain-containing protein [Clostridioides difficile]CCL06131.1 HD domain protein [Clostridioides difficile CD002]VHY49283.1 metal dependent phosphohydrolase [Clostridioides difficile]HBY3357698.1 HDOD domain-containing protein [Clostridioides difficile]